MWTKFTVRKTRPTGGIVYNNSKNGGISWCVNGKPTDSKCNVLHNCVGYADGRFEEIYREITGYKENKMKFWYLCNNAENWVERAVSYGLETGDTPRPGAVICWQKGTLKDSDGAGHVAIVEEVYDDGSILTSESGWNASVPFKTVKRAKGTGNWGQSSAYKFRCFIYNPAVKWEEDPKPEKVKIKCPCCGEIIWNDGTKVDPEPVDPYWYYTVQSRDTLWGIASKWYGKGSLYKVILEDNKDIIKNANVIHGGQVLKMRKDMTVER